MLFTVYDWRAPPNSIQPEATARRACLPSPRTAKPTKPKPPACGTACCAP
ncbi:MAG: hypothetical protein WKG07_27760 [Hymenobacter sp.]